MFVCVCVLFPYLHSKSQGHVGAVNELNDVNSAFHSHPPIVMIDMTEKIAQSDVKLQEIYLSKEMILRFFVLFNRISVKSGQLLDDNENVCALEPRLPLVRLPTQAGLEPETARSVCQRLTY